MAICVLTNAVPGGIRVLDRIVQSVGVPVQRLRIIQIRDEVVRLREAADKRAVLSNDDPDHE